MSFAAEYRARTQARLTLSTGHTVTVRSLNYADLLQLRSKIPSAWMTLSPEEQAKNAESDRYSAELMIYMLTHCVTEGPKIVEGRAVADDELSVYELTNADAQAISAAIRGATGKGEPPRADTFPDTAGPATA